MRLAAAVFAAFLALAANAGAQNLVANGEFDTGAGVASWTAGPLVQLEWTADDWQGDPGSGSARMTNQAPCGGTYFFQCVPVPTPLAASYDLGASVLLESPPQSASAYVQAIFYPEAGCQGVSTGSWQLGVFNQPVWVSLFDQAITLPPTTHAVLIQLVVTKLPFIPSCLPPQGPVSARYDHIRFGPTGTTPVRLQSLSVE